MVANREIKTIAFIENKVTMETKTLDEHFDDYIEKYYLHYLMDYREEFKSFFIHVSESLPTVKGVEGNPSAEVVLKSEIDKLIK